MATNVDAFAKMMQAQAALQAKQAAHPVVVQAVPIASVAPQPNGAAPAKKKKDKNAPKKARSAYMYFSMDERVKIKAENAEIKFGDAMKLCGERWKVLGEEEKKKYVQMADDDKVRYAEEMKAYTPPDEASETKKRKRKPKKDPRAPKRNKSAYMCFMATARGKVVAENPEAKQTEIMKLAAGQWRELDEEGKKKYEEMAAKDKERYASELIAYNLLLKKESIPR
jgi:hypothetical protein